MIQYVKQEYTDLNGTGKRPLCYKVVPTGRISREELVRKVAGHDSKYNAGDVGAVISQIETIIAELLLDGYTIDLGEIGSIKLALGVKEGKEQESVGDTQNRHNAQSVKVKDIHIKASKKLLNKVADKAKFEYAGTNCHYRQQYTKPQRLSLLKQLLHEKPFVHANDYAQVAEISLSQATRELREFALDPSSGIARQGKRASLVYMLKQ